MQNKKAKMQKKAENARSISKLMQKRAEMQKKGRKFILDFDIHTKKSKMDNRKHIYLDFFHFYISCAFF